MYGWPVPVHYCDSCSYNTPVAHSVTVWRDNHTCSHCGSAAPGADIAGSTASTMNHAQHDELAQLFAQRMHLSQMGDTHHSQTQQAPPLEAVSQQSEKADKPVNFVSSHYTGTAHLRPDTTSETSHSPPPPYHEALTPEVMAETLRHHSIDPSALLPHQVQLFQNADHEQRLRLLELWRISRPSYPLDQHLETTWVPTSVEEEEQEARLRYEQYRQQEEEERMQAQVPRHQEEHMLDTFEPISPIREAGDPAWPPAARMRAASIASAKASSRPLTMYGSDPEPYIVNGYHADHPTQAVDPVYAAAAGLWQSPNYAHAVQQQSTMEDQYGMYEQIRNHLDWERMNEQIARENFVGLHGPPHVGGMDDDMVM